MTRSDISNVEAYYAVGFGVGTTAPTNVMLVGQLGPPTPTLIEQTKMFGVLPKASYALPSLNAFVKAGCTADPKTKATSATVAVWTSNGTTPVQFAASPFKLAKGACSPALP